MGARFVKRENWGYSGFSCDSSGSYFGLSVTINTRETLQGTRSSCSISRVFIFRLRLQHIRVKCWTAPEGRGRILLVFVSACVIGKNPEYPQLELHGWRRHYTGRYKSSGISFLYLWLKHKWKLKHTFEDLIKLWSLRFWCWLPQHTEKWNWRNASWEDQDIFSAN